MKDIYYIISVEVVEKKKYQILDFWPRRTSPVTAKKHVKNNVHGTLSDLDSFDNL